MEISRKHGGAASTISILLALSLFSFFLESCSYTAPIVLLNHIDVNAQIHQTPIRVTDSDMAGHLRITPNVEFMPVRKISGNIRIPTDPSIEALPRYDSTEDLSWNLPSYVAGLGFDYGLTKVLSISGDGNYSRVGGNRLFEWDLGLGLCFEGRNDGGRLEAGVQWEDASYNAVFDKYEVFYHSLFGVGDSAAYQYSFATQGTHTSANFYINLTLNTRYHSSPVNGFARIGYGVTSLISESMVSAPKYQAPSTAVGFLSLTPGLFFNLDKTDQLVVGCQFITPTSGDNMSPEWMISPIVQLDVTI